MGGRRSKKRRDERYAAAVRRQIEFNRGLAAYRRPHTPIEQFLRPGDTADMFDPTAEVRGCATSKPVVSGPDVTDRDRRAGGCGTASGTPTDS